jgi:hypothetical protein
MTTSITNNRLILTLKYMLHIKGHYTIPEKSFPYRMGCHNSDMFRIAISCNDDEYFPDGISLSEYHAAFLCSPVFQMELWLLTTLGIITNIDPVTTTIQHLQGVATGDHSSFGPWTTWAIEGNRSRPIASVSTLSSSSSNINSDTKSTASSSSVVAPCVIMRCRTRHGPFCDTWWALELEEATNQQQGGQHRRPQLVFGTALLSGANNSILARIMTPLHRFYSRLLLASCKATLVYQYHKHQR